jgi:hypothetical protein
MVMLEPDGTASSVVLGGANTAWPEVGSMTSDVSCHVTHACNNTSHLRPGF